LPSGGFDSLGLSRVEREHEAIPRPGPKTAGVSDSAMRDGRYAIRDGVVFCELELRGQTASFEVELDAASFEDLGQGYARDAGRVVKNGEPLDDADAATFVVLRGDWAKDANAVYHAGAIAEEPEDGPWDSATFTAFGARYVADRRGVFCRHYGHDCYDVDRVEDADATAFEELGLTLGRDRRAGVIYNNGVVEEGVDAASLVLHGRWFATDRANVFHLRYGGKHTDALGLAPIEADPATFRVLGEHYAADARTVFYFLNDDGDADLAEIRALPGVAPERFEVLTAIDPGYARAGDVILNHGEIETGIADPASFEVLPDGSARDRLHTYRFEEAPRTVSGSKVYVVFTRVLVVVDRR
jgi:DKNYY family